MNTLTIHEIEKLTEDQVMKNAESVETLKGFTLYFIDLKGYFGYSVLVFKDGYYIKYANDYQLHHKSIKDINELKKYYIKKLNNRLYTNEELRSITDYKDFNAKYMFLINDKPTTFECVSSYDEKVTVLKESYKYYFMFNYYFNEDDQKEIREDFKVLCNAHKEKMANDDAYFESAIYYELANHEAGYTCDYTDGLGALGLRFEKLSSKNQIIVTNTMKRLMAESYN